MSNKTPALIPADNFDSVAAVDAMLKEALRSHHVSMSNDRTALGAAGFTGRQNVIVYGRLAGGLAPDGNRYVRGIDTTFFAPNDEAERIDSAELLRALRAATNILTTGTEAVNVAFLDGTSLMSVSQHAALSAPLMIPCLAVALGGRSLPVRVATLRLLSGFVIKLESMLAEPGHALTAQAGVNQTGDVFTLYVSAPDLGAVVWECALDTAVSPAPNDVEAMLVHEPEFVGTVDTAAMRRAFRRSVRAMFNAHDMAKKSIDRDSEGRRHTAIEFGDGQVSLARLHDDGDENWPTVEPVAQWKRVPVRGSAADGTASRIIEGRLIEVLTAIAPTFSVGLSQNGGPVSFWTDDGLRIAACAAKVTT